MDQERRTETQVEGLEAEGLEACEEYRTINRVAETLPYVLVLSRFRG